MRALVIGDDLAAMTPSCGHTGHALNARVNNSQEIAV
jgi:hypothetical protein